MIHKIDTVPDKSINLGLSMQMAENIKISMRSIRANKIRTFLTLLIISFGILALVGILSVIDVMVASLGKSFVGMGANSFLIEPISLEFESGGNGKKRQEWKAISYDEAIDFKEKYRFPASTAVYMRAAYDVRAEYSGEKSNPNLMLVGIDQNFFSIKGKKLAEGRSFSISEVNSGDAKAILGSQVATMLFGSNKKKALQKQIKINQHRYQVVGILESKGSTLNQRDDRKIYVPLLHAKNHYGHPKKNYNIEVLLDDGADMVNAESSAAGIFRNIRGLNTRDPNNFEIVKSEHLLNTIREETSKLRLAAILIGGITLFSAAIGLMNIMLVSVTERTKEIGIRKSLGASSKDILQQFLTEAIVICQLGGGIGILLSLIPVLLIAKLMGGDMSLPWKWIAVGIVVCTVVGLASGLFPAVKASKLDPIDALRHE